MSERIPVYEIPISIGAEYINVLTTEKQIDLSASIYDNIEYQKPIGYLVVEEEA